MMELTKQTGELAKCIMMQENYYFFQVDNEKNKKQLANELADIFGQIIRVADYYQIDLLQAHIEARKEEDSILLQEGYEQFIVDLSISIAREKTQQITLIKEQCMFFSCKDDIKIISMDNVKIRNWKAPLHQKYQAQTKFQSVLDVFLHIYPSNPI